MPWQLFVHVVVRRFARKQNRVRNVALLATERWHLIYWLRWIQVVCCHLIMARRRLKEIESVGIKPERDVTRSIEPIARRDFVLRFIQCHPGSQRIRVVSPMDDFSAFNCDNRDEPVVTRCAARKDLAMYFIFEDYDATILRAMDDKCIVGVQLDRLPISR
jgi:hypothetical protein